MRTALLIFASAALGLSLENAAACDGCGCRGGPGYRGPDGHCVGWAKLNKICGNPPTRCAVRGRRPGSRATGVRHQLRESGLVPDQRSTASAIRTADHLQRAAGDQRWPWLHRRANHSSSLELRNRAAGERLRAATCGTHELEGLLRDHERDGRCYRGWLSLVRLAASTRARDNPASLDRTKLVLEKLKGRTSLQSTYCVKGGGNHP